MKKVLNLLLMAALITVATMKTSQAAINKLKSGESFSATAYKDSRTDNGVQLYSIGYGHQIQPNELHLKTETITKLTAEKLMRTDIAPLELQINQAVPKGFNQNQFDACIDFGYNCGSGALSKVLKTWTSTHSTEAVTAHMKQYIHTRDNNTGQTIVSKTLVARRNENAKTFTSTVMPPLGTIAIVGGLALAYLALT